jgi:hypothetical protein
MESIQTFIKIVGIILIFVSLIQLIRKWKIAARKIICPKCGYNRIPEIKTEGNTLIGVLLLLLGAIPGLLYFLWFMKTHYLCPKCKTEIKKI